MNAHALLTSQGWRGTGHSLHPTSDTTGLSRPILVARKQNTLGVGKKQHKTSDMWWMNAFDSSLKGLDTSKKGTVTQTMTSGGLDMVTKGGGKYVGKGGLYANFVRGEVLGGTRPSLVRLENVEESQKIQELKRNEQKENKDLRRARKAAKRAAMEQAASAQESTESTAVEDEIGISETKEERRVRKAAKRAKREQQNTSLGDIEAAIAKRESKENRRKRKISGKSPQQIEKQCSEASSEKLKKKEKKRK